MSVVPRFAASCLAVDVNRRKVDMEGSSLAQFGLHLEVASALRDDAVDRRQPQSGAVFLGGEKRLENTGLRFPAHAAPRIADTQHHVAPRLDARVQQGIFI